MSRRECGDKARKAGAAYFDVAEEDISLVFLDELVRPGEIPSTEAVVRVGLR